MRLIGHHWVAAAESGFAQPTDWKRWADLRIEQSEIPENWIISLALSSTAEELRQACVPRMDAERRSLGEGIALGNATLGFLYWKFLLGRCSWESLLLEAGAEADSGTADLECETIYWVLNKLETRHRRCRDTADLRRRTESLFNPFLATAEQAWRELEMPLPSEGVPRFDGPIAAKGPTLSPQTMLAASVEQLESCDEEEWGLLVRYLVDRLRDWQKGVLSTDDPSTWNLGDGFCVHVEQRSVDGMLQWKGVLGGALVDDRLNVTLTLFPASELRKSQMTARAVRIADYQFVADAASQRGRWELLGWFTDVNGEYEGMC